VGVFPVAVVIVTKEFQGTKASRWYLWEPECSGRVNGRDSISAHGKIQQKEGIQRREAR